MAGRDVLTLKGDEVETLLVGREHEVLAAIAAAYRAHGEGKSSLPNSLFLRFPDDERNRIIALPAYLGGGFDLAGVKWVSSFPSNIEKGLNRASAVIVLNSAQTGQPEVIMEGSVVSAKRTAASAALAAQHLVGEGAVPEAVGFVGCGPINFEVARFLLAVWPSVRRFHVYDLDARRAEQFKEKCGMLSRALDVETATELEAILRATKVTSLATTAVKPHIFDLSACAPGSTLLHVSLRDLSPEAILACDNVVDDAEHVCRAQTSVHLAEQLTGNRDFIRCTLADILNATAGAKTDAEALTVFSPFGLGILDLAVGGLVATLAREAGCGTVLEDFLPASYAERE